MFPHFLPGGQRFLLYVRGTPNEQGIHLGSLGSQTTTRLTAADSAGAYLPPGWLLFVRNGSLVAQGFDASRGELRGEPLTVAETVGFSANARVGAFSTSATGAVIYQAAVERPESRLMWFDRTGKPLGTLGAFDVDNSTPALSPDGRRVAVSRSGPGNSSDIYILDSVRMTRLTLDDGSDASPIWSPDGNWIAFRSNRKGPYNLYKKRSDGAGGEELLLDSPLHMVPNDWAHGRLLFTKDNDPKTVIRPLVDADGERPRRDADRFLERKPRGARRPVLSRRALGGLHVERIGPT